MANDFDAIYDRVVAVVLVSWMDCTESTDTLSDAVKSVQDAATNSYQDDFTQNEWVAATLARLNGVVAQ